MNATVRTITLCAWAAIAAWAPTPARAATLIRNGDRLVLTGPIGLFDDIRFRAALDDNGQDGGFGLRRRLRGRSNGNRAARSGTAHRYARSLPVPVGLHAHLDRGGSARTP